MGKKIHPSIIDGEDLGRQAEACGSDCYAPVRCSEISSAWGLFEVHGVDTGGEKTITGQRSAGFVSATG